MKKQFQDIIPSDKRSIRNIPLPEKKKAGSSSKVLNIRRAPVESEEAILENEKEELKKIAPRKRREILEELKEDTSDFVPTTKGGPRIFLWIITVVAAFALFVAISSIFKSATIYVTQKSLSFTLSGPYTFYVNPKAGQEGYSVLTVTDSATAEVAASGEKQVKSSASGTIVVYNNFSTGTQKLIAGTRFETPAGLIFKLNNDVVVPGLTKQKGKSTPGSIDAQVTAEKSGSDYNISLSDFTIPGFKGDPKYSGFYGRSKTPMTGGSSGMVATVDDTTLSSAVSDLKSRLDASLRDKASKQLPAAQQTFDGFSKVTYAVSDPKLLGGDLKGKAEVKVDGSARVYALDMQSFAKKLLQSQAASSTDIQYSIDFSDVKATLGTEASSTLSATLEGRAEVIWNLNQAAFLAAVSGKPVAEVPTIASSFPAIAKTAVVIKPFTLWNPTLPNNTKKISIKIQN